MIRKTKGEPRPLDAIQADYMRVCAEIGDLVYRLEVGIPATLGELKARAKALNLEAEQARQLTPSKEM